MRASPGRGESGPGGGPPVQRQRAAKRAEAKRAAALASRTLPFAHTSACDGGSAWGWSQK